MGLKLLRDHLKLGGAIILFDRDYGVFFFQNFRGYSNLLDDAEWLLERTPQKSWGFIIRPIISGEQYGLWIGEYGPHKNQVIREEMIFDKKASTLSKMLFDYEAHKIDEKKIRRKLTLDSCKKLFCKSKIIRNFKYYTCPAEYFYKHCPYIEKIYKSLIEKYGRGSKVHYSLVIDEISSIKQCDNVLICPLMTANTFEAIMNLNKALRYRKTGEIKIVDQNMVEIL